MRTAATILLLASLTLVGCSTTDDAKPAVSPSVSPTTDPGNVFVSSVIDAHLDSYTSGIPAAAELELFPPEWCEARDDGHSVEWMFDMTGGGGLYPVGETWGTEKSDAYQVLVLGVKAYCPKHTEELVAELRASGEY
jgi:hypothetical protein